MRKITLRQVAQAIEDNGLPQTIDSFYRDGFGKIAASKKGAVSACALGMAAINLKCSPHTLTYTLNKEYSNLGDSIILWNDNQHYSFKDIADHIRREMKYILDVEVPLRAAK